jgi:hypothetical protein
MERASRLLRSLPIPSDSISAEELAARAWPLAVGRKVAAHSRPVRMVRTRLVVEVEDIVWQRQLFTLTRQIVANLERTLGRGLVEDIEFVIMPRKREPRRAVAMAAPALFADEADAIPDPMLRTIYKASRKKALA